MNSTARKVAAILVAATVIAGPFASVVSMVSAAPVGIPTCTDTQTYNADNNTCVDNQVAPPIVADDFKISGVVFNDLDTSGTYNNGDVPLKDWEVDIHQGDQNGPVVTPIDYTDKDGNYFYGNLPAGDYYVEEIVNKGWDQTTSDMHVTLSSDNSDVTVNFANVQLPTDNGGGDTGGNGGTGGDTGGTTPPPPPVTTLTVDASAVVCTDATQLPDWGATGHPAITATSAKDWVAAHASCSLASGWSFDYAYQYTAFGGDTTIGHDNDFTAFGPTAATGSTTVSFTPASTTAIQVREQLQDGFIPFTYTADNTNATVPSAQMYCNTDVLNYDNADFITAPAVGGTYYCVSFNSPTPVVTPPANNPTTDASTNTGGNGGGGGGGGVIGGPLSIGFVNTNPTGGLVLGTSTEDSSGPLPTGCTALLTTYLRQGKHNDSGEVSKLQTFLNQELGLTIPVTGYFGSMTTDGVNQFQVKYKDDVLSPWSNFGGNGKPTGYVYKTTGRKINLLACSSLDIPVPQLP